MADSGNHGGGDVGGSGVIEFTGKIMVVAIILLFFVIVFVFCLHLYAKWFWYRRQETSRATTTTMRRRRRLDFAAGYQEITVVSQGLDASVLKTIPVKLFEPEEFKEGLECAVCLCEVSKGEKTRLLPKCNHGFHVECIDMWFQSHSTCPLCRNPVSNTKEASTGTESALESMLQGEGSSETANFPTNVLFWGDETRVSTFCVEGEDHESSSSSSNSSGGGGGGSNAVEQFTSSNGSTSSRPDGVLVIDVLRQVHEEDEHEKSPVPTRLRSLKRLLSGNRRVNPSSPRNFDVEQGPRNLS